MFLRIGPTSLFGRIALRTQCARTGLSHLQAGDDDHESFPSRCLLSKLGYFQGKKKDFFILNIGHSDSCAIHLTIKGAGFPRGRLVQQQEQEPEKQTEWV